MEISSRDLRLVAVIDQHRHFGRAAETLGISQPALSRAVKALEERVGTTLFLRSRAGVQTTEVGQMISERARSLLADLRDLGRDITRARGEGLGELTVAVGHYPAELTVPLAVGRLLTARPQLQFTLRTQDWTSIRDALVRREVDLALCETSLLETDERIHVDPVGAHPVFFFARANHPLGGQENISPPQLFDYPWAMARIPWRAAQHFPDRARDCPAGAMDGQEGMFIPRVAATSMYLAKKIVRNSQCLALSTLSQLSEELARGELQLLSYHASWMYLHYGFARLTSRPAHPPALEFIEQVELAEQKLRDRERELRERYWGSRGLGTD